MSFWANVFLGKHLLGKRLMGQGPSGQMSFWANVFWADVMEPCRTVVESSVYEASVQIKNRLQGMLFSHCVYIWLFLVNVQIS
jgi:hypothetical protein